MSVELKAAERLENLRKQHGGICTPYACDICWLLEQLDDAHRLHTPSPQTIHRLRQSIKGLLEESAKYNTVKYRRELWIRFMCGVLVGSVLTAIILTFQVWWLDNGGRLF